MPKVPQFHNMSAASPRLARLLFTYCRKPSQVPHGTKALFHPRAPVGAIVQVDVENREGKGGVAWVGAGLLCGMKGGGGREERKEGTNVE